MSNKWNKKYKSTEPKVVEAVKEEYTLDEEVFEDMIEDLVGDTVMSLMAQLLPHKDEKFMDEKTYKTFVEYGENYSFSNFEDEEVEFEKYFDEMVEYTFIHTVIKLYKDGILLSDKIALDILNDFQTKGEF